MQTKSVIQKSPTLTSIHYKTSQGLLIATGNEFTVVIGDDGLVGARSLDAGLRFIGWNEKTDTTTEFIFWNNTTKESK